MKQLWRMRLFVLLGSVLAALGGAATGYQIHPGLPPSFEEKSLTYGTATTELLVDSNKSSLGKINVDLELLAGRAQVFSRFVSSAPIKREIARELKISPAVISTVGPATPAPTSGDTAVPGPADLVSASDEYRLIGFSAEDSTIFNLFAQGPDVEQAVNMANAAARSMSSYVERLGRRQKVRKHLRLRLTQLGPADGGLVNSGANQVLVGLVFVALLVMWCLVLLLAARVVGGFRADEGLTRDDLERLLAPPDGGPTDPHRSGAER